MGTTTDQEREFYDRVYAQHLSRPDHELVVNQHVIRSSLNDPAQTIWERRRLYQAVLETLLTEQLAETNALDYGCGPSDWGVLMATEGARVTLLDLSPTAIELGLKRAKASGVAHLVRGIARDAADLSCFADGEFDLIFGSAAVHHTLKYGDAFAELVRVLRPGGKMILAEPLGNNLILNTARWLRATLSRELEEQGEDIIIGDAEIRLLESSFSSVEVRPMNLLAMGKRLLRGHFTRPGVRRVVEGLESLDDLLLRRLPRLESYCGEAVIVAVR